MIEAVQRAEAPPSRIVKPSELRRHQRVRVALLGRYMLSDLREYPCQTVDMSPGGVRVTCAVLGAEGERVVLYLEQIGRVEGTIARHPPGGIAVRLNATPRKRDKIASQLTWLANRESLGLPEGRTHERLTPARANITLRLDSGRDVAARVIDISMSGAAIATSSLPPIGASIVVGSTPCRVVRYFEGGIGVHFMLSISPDDFHEGLVL